MIFSRKFSFHAQHDAMDCGPACLKMIAGFYGRTLKLDSLRERSYITKNGVNFLGLMEAGTSIGMRTLAVKAPLSKISQHAPFPCIIHWEQNHFIVLYKIKGQRFYLADPGKGLLVLNRQDFVKGWTGGQDIDGLSLLLEPTDKFYEINENIGDRAVNKRTFLCKYIKQYKVYLFQLLLCMLLTSGLTALFPFFTQRIVDKGINNKNIGIVQLILISQVLVIFGSTSIEYIRSWVLLHLNSRINITIVSDFLIKLMRLPISFFDTKHLGDIRQRMADHGRIQSFLTGQGLSTLFSMINLIVYSIVLACYDVLILLIFFSFSLLSISWAVLFLKKRKSLDYVRFQQMSENENVFQELVTGMQEIKLNNCERVKRWEWERIQAKMFDLGIKGLTLGQFQQSGSTFLNQIKNILISYCTAVAVIKGDITLGMMMGISYIIGQLNTPFQMMMGFLQSAQDAKISLDRLSEIHDRPDEDNTTYLQNFPAEKSRNGIHIHQLSHQYTGATSPFVLKEISLHIPVGKVTAIVGESGSGKTTLMKLLLNFYKPTTGSININGVEIDSLSRSFWRSQCGVVMQEGLLFSNSIKMNIVMGDEHPNDARLTEAIQVANLKEFIDGLPMGWDTKVGPAGVGMSTGQKQRLLIARAVYKNPSFIFLDEATSALDANNERTIIDNLQEFYLGRTVVIIAHRLSTVKKADQILVLENGNLAEIGKHDELISARRKYYQLIKNQLENIG